MSSSLIAKSEPQIFGTQVLILDVKRIDVRSSRRLVPRFEPVLIELVSRVNLPVDGIDLISSIEKLLFLISGLWPV